MPVIELGHLSEAQKRAYILADNRLAEAAGWDRELLALEVGELADLGIDLGSLGFESTPPIKCREKVPSCLGRAPVLPAGLQAAQAELAFGVLVAGGLTRRKGRHFADLGAIAAVRAQGRGTPPQRSPMR